MLRRLAAAAAAAISRMQPEECELLYGRAGLLYALLFTRSLWLPPPPPQYRSFFSDLVRRQSQEDGKQDAAESTQDCSAGLFRDCDEGIQTTTASSSRKSSSSQSSLQEVYLRAASTVSVGVGSGRIPWPLSLNYGGSLRLGSSGSSSYKGSGSSRSHKSGGSSSSIDGGLQESASGWPEELPEEQQATRVLVLSLIAQLVGQLVAHGRVEAVVAEKGSIRSLEPREQQRLHSSAASAFTKASPLPLLYEWHGKQYLGAAHGICGILLQLQQAVDTLYHAAAAGCFPGPAARAGGSAAAAVVAAAREAELSKEAIREEAESAAARLLACSATVCSAMQHREREDMPIFCPAASAFLCCHDGLAAAASLRDTVRRLCLSSLMALLRFHLTDTANLKSSIGSDRDLLVQWCHGAPGLVPLICWAVDLHREKALAYAQYQRHQQGSLSSENGLLPEDRPTQEEQHRQKQRQQQEQHMPNLYRRHSSTSADAELKSRENLGFFMVWLDTMGNITWQRGLLCKGLGVCHGIGGNGMALLCAYNSSGNPRWLRRALLFALEGIIRHLQLLHLPDRPWSLFEGASGFSVFLRDCAETLFAACTGSTRPITAYYIGYQLPPLPWEQSVRGG